MNKSEKRKEKMNELAKLFNAQTGEKVSRSCSGKWSGTIDYSIRFNNGCKFFISNGMERFDHNLDYLLKVYGTFKEKKAEIISILREMEKDDMLMAAENNLKSYHVIDVDYQKNDDDYIGWFYVVIEVDGVQTTIQETGLCYSIKNFCNDGNKDHLLSKMSSKYYVAGGVDTPEYVFHGYGFSIDTYTAHGT